MKKIFYITIIAAFLGACTGEIGPAGDKGDTGAPGAPGANGTVGAKGATGDAGAAGVKGATGVQGDKGATPQIQVYYSDWRSMATWIKTSITTNDDYATSFEGLIDFIPNPEKTTIDSFNDFAQYPIYEIGTRIPIGTLYYYNELTLSNGEKVVFSDKYADSNVNFTYAGSGWFKTVNSKIIPSINISSYLRFAKASLASNELYLAAIAKLNPKVRFFYVPNDSEIKGRIGTKNLSYKEFITLFKIPESGSGTK